MTLNHMWGSKIEFLEIWSTFSFPLLLDPLWPNMVVSVRVPSMDQIELFNHLLYLKQFECKLMINIKLNY